MTDAKPHTLFDTLNGIIDTLEKHDARLDAIGQTREERKVPQPLTVDDMLKAGIPVFARRLEGLGLGIYRIADIEEACRK